MLWLNNGVYNMNNIEYLLMNGKITFIKNFKLYKCNICNVMVFPDINEHFNNFHKELIIDVREM